MEGKAQAPSPPRTCRPGPLGLHSKPLIACQFEDTFGMLALQKPVIGARPTNFGTGRPGAEPGISAHG
jgi:hypothetical protein